jgi:hypothetical protein
LLSDPFRQALRAIFREPAAAPVESFARAKGASMTEDPTNGLTTDEILRLILNRLTDIETILGANESLVEDRLKDTRPIWQAIDTRTERIEATLSDIKGEMATLA